MHTKQISFFQMDLKKYFLMVILALGLTITHVFGQEDKKIPLGKVNKVLEAFDSPKNPLARTAGPRSIKYSVAPGQEIELTLGRIVGSAGRRSFVGKVEGDAKSLFYLNEKEGKLQGHVVLTKEKKAFEYITSDEGDVFLVEKDIDEVMCIEGSQEIPAQFIPEFFFTPVTNTAQAFSYQSLPGAQHTIFLDFDGYLNPSSIWHNGQPNYFRASNFSDEQIRQTYERVSEDFSAFNINVTTDSTVFKNTAPGKRIRALFTQLLIHNSGTGGIAMIDAFQWTTNEQPALIYVDQLGANSNASAEAASHEIGHTLGLDHDGTPFSGYYGGHENWGPIMGTAYGRDYSQWSIGEYEGATNTSQDDIAIIAGTKNGFGFKSDDHGNTLAAATLLTVTSGHFERKGIITDRSDVDVFSFTIPGTSPVQLEFSVNVKQEESNLKFMAEIHNSSNALLTTFTSQNAGGVSGLLAGLPAGTYYVFIDGVGQGDPLNTGFSDYSSIGSYTLSGTIISSGGGCTAPAWNSSIAYNGNTEVSYAGNLYRSKWWTMGEQPNLNTGDGKPWLLVGPCSNNQLPVVSISQPLNNFVLNGTELVLTATASDADGSIAYVEFYNGVDLIGRVNNAPYKFLWTDIAVGTHSVTAKAYDNGGGSKVSSVATIISNQIPWINITSPVELSKVLQGSSITINVNYSDEGGQVVKVEYFWDNGIKAGESTTAPFSFTTVVPGLTNYQEYLLGLTAIATDNQGGKGRHSIDLKLKPTVENAKPIARVDYPQDGSPLVVDMPFTINASGYDIDGYVTKVEIYFDGTKVGEADGTSATAEGIIPSAGFHDIMVVVTDEEGATGSVTTKMFGGQVPTISITSPAPNTVFPEGSTITIVTNPADADGEIIRVEFYMNGQRGESTSAPWTFTSQPVTYAQSNNGSFPIIAVAFDNSGMARATNVTVIISNSTNVAPEVSIIQPTNNALLQAGYTYTLAANATDSDGTISKVEFFDGSTKIGEDLTAPFELSWIASSGGHSFTAVATDNGGLTKTSAPVNVTVNAAPTASFVSPVANALYAQTGSMLISVNATDSDGSIAKVEFFLGGMSNKVGEDLQAPYSVNVSSVPLPTSGQNILPVIVKVTDNQGGISVVDTYVRSVVNSAPVANITAPSNNATFSTGTNILISVNAIDAEVNTPVTSVEFYRGTTLLYTDTQSPWQYTLANAANGSYTYNVKAKDLLGAISATATVNFSVGTTTCSDPAWSASAIYVSGNIVSRSGKRYKANWWNQNVDPVTHSAPYQEWTLLGNCTAVRLAEESESVNFQFYPNPVNEEAFIAFTLSTSDNISVRVFNSLGEQVQTAFEGSLEEGMHTLKINTQNFISGIYILKAEGSILNEQVTFMKE